MPFSRKTAGAAATVRHLLDHCAAVPSATQWPNKCRAFLTATTVFLLHKMQKIWQTNSENS